MLRKLRLWVWRRQFRPGRVVTRFLAPDIRRDVGVVDIAHVGSGVITARVRTWNVLYAFRGISPEPAFGAARLTSIDDHWKWSRAAWGGPAQDSGDGAGVSPA